MRAGWTTATLADICEMYQPKTISAKEMVADGPYPVFGANGIIGRYSKFNHEEPQLLITCRGATCGSVNLSAPKSWITGNAMVVRPISDAISLKFLEYFFRGGVDISTAITGAAQPQITRTNLAPLRITYPVDVAVQRRIVAILDEAFEGIATVKANAEKNLQNARKLFENCLTESFRHRGEGWMERPLEDVSTVLSGFSFKSTDFVPVPGLKAIKITNVGVREFVCESGVYLPDKFAAKYSAFSVSQGSIVVALTRTIIAGGLKVALVPKEFDGALLNQRVASIVPNSSLLDSHFLFSYLSSPDVTTFVREHVNTLMQPNLSINDLKAMPVPLPPLSEQKKLMVQLLSLGEESQRLEGMYQQKLTALVELKKSLLHQAFSGQL